MRIRREAHAVCALMVASLFFAATISPAGEDKEKAEPAKEAEKEEGAKAEKPAKDKGKKADKNADIKTITCEKDKETKYFCYVPTGHDVKAQRPALFAFSPGGGDKGRAGKWRTGLRMASDRQIRAGRLRDGRQCFLKIPGFDEPTDDLRTDYVELCTMHGWSWSICETTSFSLCGSNGLRMTVAPQTSRAIVAS